MTEGLRMLGRLIGFARFRFETIDPESRGPHHGGGFRHAGRGPEDAGLRWPGGNEFRREALAYRISILWPAPTHDSAEAGGYSAASVRKPVASSP